MKRLYAIAFICASLAAVQAQSVNGRTARMNFGALSASGATGAVDVRALTPSKHSLQAVITGAPTGCSIQLEGSLDNAVWFNLSGAQTCTSNVFFSVTERPADYVRANLTVLSGGTTPTVTVSYVGVF